MRTLAAAAAAILGLGCSQTPGPPVAHTAWSPDPGPDLGAVVARVGQVPIFAAEVQARAARAERSPRAALEDLITFHLLAERARAAGIDPRSQEIPHELLVQRLIEREFDPITRPADIPDAELREIYDRNLASFVHPRLVEVAVLAVYTGGRMKPEPRARARATATELAAYVARRPARTADDLLAVAREPAWADRKIATHRLFQGPDRPFGAALGTAVGKLAREGDTTPVIEDETGLYIARYIGERPPENVGYEVAREKIRPQLYPSWRQRRFLELTRRLAAPHAIEAFPDHLTAAPGAVP